jgi:hypothetical protein
VVFRNPPSHTLQWILELSFFNFWGILDRITGLCSLWLLVSEGIVNELSQLLQLLSLRRKPIGFLNVVFFFSEESEAHSSVPLLESLVGRCGSGDRWVWMSRIFNTAFLKEWVMLWLLVDRGCRWVFAITPIYELVVRVLKMGLFCYTLKHKRLHKSPNRKPTKVPHPASDI